jgi:hypothetical protein
MPSELVEELYNCDNHNDYIDTYSSDKDYIREEYTDSEEDIDYTSNEYLDLISSNYQIPLVDQNRIHVLNYIDRLGFVLTNGGLYRKENYQDKYNVNDFMKEQIVTDEKSDIENNKLNIEKIINFYRQKKMQKIKHKNTNTLKTQIKEVKEFTNAWFKKENEETKESKAIKPKSNNKHNIVNTNFDKNFPTLLKTEIIVENKVENDKKDDKNKINSDESEDEEYDLSYLVQKNSKPTKKTPEIINKKSEDILPEQSKNVKFNKNDKDKGWIKVESNKEIKHTKERNNAYDILSDKDKLKTKLKRTKLCLSVLNKTNCPHKENCRYAHTFEDLEPCLFSDNCRFIKKDKGSYVNISKTKICEYKHKNETASNYFNRISVNNNINNIHSPNKNDKNLNIKKL